MRKRCHFATKETKRRHICALFLVGEMQVTAVLAKVGGSKMKLILESKLEIGPVKMNGVVAILALCFVAALIYFAPEVAAKYLSQPPQKIR